MTAPDPLADALLAARLCAGDPGLGGLIVTGAGPLLPLIENALRAALPAGAPVLRLPGHIDDERLYGGLDLGATLATGRPVARAGVLAAAHGGALVVPMADRLNGGTAAVLAAALDTGRIVAEREGVRLGDDARFVVLAEDEGEGVPAALAERLAFRVDLKAARVNLAPGALELQAPPPLAPSNASAVPPAADDALVDSIAGAALALGIDSARAPLFALRAARGAARLAGRTMVIDEDVALAARLVLAHRATRMPASEDEAPHEPPPPDSTEPGEEQDKQPNAMPPEELIVEAALAALPPDMLASLAAGAAKRKAQSQGKGARQRAAQRGRPLGARAGMPGGRRRLSLIDTMRAAAPWQRVRHAPPGRIKLARDDLRIKRFEARTEALTIFAVDASGSAALARLAEAKGAVELLLAQAYVKRAQVALIAFRGEQAELILPPTRSLARAKKALSGLPGGGGTPVAAGLNAAHELAEAAARRGRTPYLVVLSDGRANIAADGSADRARATADANQAARAIAALGIGAAFVDISPRPRPEGEALAQSMHARYLPLPRADSARVHAGVSAAMAAGPC